ncbi:phenazine biosynthesis FMN-dependent oxidase PhzG [Streptomyces sp. NPDC041068]|uniref:phenazine biosynthesis FMN-dependent oxidase PhzG n=1 Tax=Streptomyces sp. NPDC041068 TaxID=3155130 RepID=UPI0033E2FE84
MSDNRSETLTGSVDVGFPEFVTPPPEPTGLLRHWLKEAQRLGVREPRALALATADARGRPSSRILVAGEVTERGIVFISHEGSRKGRDLAENPWASGVLYWRETSQQVVVAGPVGRLSRAETEKLWQARPVFTHAMTTAARQSEPLADLQHVAELRDRARQLGESGQSLPMPDTFAAYELRIDSVEFWAKGTDRLHERLRYDIEGDGTWHISRLQP